MLPLATSTSQPIDDPSASPTINASDLTSFVPTNAPSTKDVTSAPSTLLEIKYLISPPSTQANIPSVSPSVTESSHPSPIFAKAEYPSTANPTSKIEITGAPTESKRSFTRETIAPEAGNIINSSNNEMNGSVEKSKAADISLILLAISVFLIAAFLAYKVRKISEPPELYHVVQSRDSSTRATRVGRFFRMFGIWSKSGSIDSASSYN